MCAGEVRAHGGLLPWPVASRPWSLTGSSVSQVLLVAGNVRSEILDFKLHEKTVSCSWDLPWTVQPFVSVSFPVVKLGGTGAGEPGRWGQW